MKINPVFTRYRNILVGILSPNGDIENPPPLARIIAKMIDYLVFYYEEIIREENPETRRFPEDDPYTIAECWAEAKGFKRCLKMFLDSLPANEQITKNSLSILDHLLIEEEEKK